MTRSKVKLAYMTNAADRKTSYQKRKRGLIKKVSELSTICDVPVCAVIYSEYDPVPEVWPSPQGAKEIFDRFNGLSKMEKTKNMVTQESFIRQSIKTAQEQLIHLHEENLRTELEIFMYQCKPGLNSPELFDMQNYDYPHMKSFFDQTIRDVKLRIDELKKQNNQPVQADPTFDSARAVVPCAPQPSQADVQHDQWSSMVNEYIKDGVHHLHLNPSFRHGWEYNGEVLPHPHLPNSYDPSTSTCPNTGSSGC